MVSGQMDTAAAATVLMGKNSVDILVEARAGMVALADRTALMAVQVAEKVARVVLVEVDLGVVLGRLASDSSLTSTTSTMRSS